MVNEDILENITSKIMKNETNFSEELESEISKELIEYLNQKYCIRKIIPFKMHEKMAEGPSYITIEKMNETLTVGKPRREGLKFKIKQNFKQKLTEELHNLMIRETNYIINYLIKYAEENNLIKSIKEDNDEEIIDSLINAFVGDKVIADKKIKAMLLKNEIYKNNSDSFNSNNLCFLKEAENYIICIDFDEGIFEVLEDNKLINLEIDNKNYYSQLRLYDMISIKAFSDDFISVIKIN
ncbi:hypothetical protein MBBAR_1c02280 [Methanobrevibacter arboriphilus JCM 13429 = DSM 1125]|uniref:Uncharacterized protein n=1 Tax=Methanobrevibacter arboriphilus JCM 13429 = DSM 1125 TaxID=1300164 RepID=A0A1V6N535_METAZ|nr:hypothetical protein [Methanobrevibacter arboriphilus]OQD59820.1 hypothetical protein MBBAR_1c02280 [Methanobrevibacter arboriphilus JCM 13429 = DSM 1125]